MCHFVILIFFNFIFNLVPIFVIFVLVPFFFKWSNFVLLQIGTNVFFYINVLMMFLLNFTFLLNIFGLGL